MSIWSRPGAMSAQVSQSSPEPLPSPLSRSMSETRSTSRSMVTVAWSWSALAPCQRGSSMSRWPLSWSPPPGSPADPRLDLGGARHVQRGVLSGGVASCRCPRPAAPRPHPRRPSPRWPGPGPPVSPCGPKVPEALPWKASSGRSRSTAGAWKWFDAQIDLKPADPLAGLQELAGAVEDQPVQAGDVPRGLGHSGRQGGLPGETGADVLEEAGAGVARHRGQGDGVGVELEQVAGPGGPVAGGLQAAVSGSPDQLLQADLGGGALDRGLEAARGGAGRP